MIWLKFRLHMTLIGVAGTTLSRYGDVIVDKTGLVLMDRLDVAKVASSE
ncbi:MAG: hypothetical protein ACYDBH_07260 [Acidobacteriaceae bacterium]